MRIFASVVSLVAILSFGSLSACDRSASTTPDAAPPVDAAPATTASAPVVDAAAPPGNPHDAHGHAAAAASAKVDGGHVAAEPPNTVDICTTNLTPKDVAVAKVGGMGDKDGVDGTLNFDGPTFGTRRFRIRMRRSSGATSDLLFEGYGAGDQKPPSESLKVGKSVVVREVPNVDHDHLFFDMDLPIPAHNKDPMDTSFLCREKF